MPIKNLSEKEITQALTYAGLILVAFELVKGMIIKPIKAFYENVTFGEGMPFHSYERDVSFRHKNQFEACTLYLRDFMEAINSEDVMTIQALRKHRNDLAHDLPDMLKELNIAQHLPLLEKINKTLFKLSNYRTYMEIGSDPEFTKLGIDWDTVKGHEYLLFEQILEKVKILTVQNKNA